MGMKRVALGVVLVAGFAAVSHPAFASERPRVVVELFTSQGCSSCPPANANLVKIADDPGVLALSFSVTYWDYLGWKDVFGKPEYTDRQVVYEPALGKRGPFTPQMVFNGSSTTIGHDLPEVREFVADAPALSGPDLSLGQSRVKIGALKSVGGTHDVWLVRYDPNLNTVPVGRGENAGATLTQVHVVRDLQRLGDWNGTETSFSLPRSSEGYKTAVLVQARNGGPILAAVTD